VPGTHSACAFAATAPNQNTAAATLCAPSDMTLLQSSVGRRCSGSELGQTLTRADHMPCNCATAPCIACPAVPAHAVCCRLHGVQPLGIPRGCIHKPGVHRAGRLAYRLSACRRMDHRSILQRRGTSSGSHCCSGGCCMWLLACADLAGW
jgi:hypothetical protein